MIINIRLAIPVFLLLALSGCTVIFGGGDILDEKVEERKNLKSSFVYGYIDMDESSTGLEWVQLNEISSSKKDSGHWMRVKDGVFYLENLAPGAYQLSRFGGIHRGVFCRGGIYCSYPVYFTISVKDKVFRLDIKKPGLYFMGAVKWEEVDTGFFESDKYSLIAIEKPTKKEMLTTILPLLKKTKWEYIVRNTARKMK